MLGILSLIKLAVEAREIQFMLNFGIVRLQKYQIWGKIMLFESV